MSHGRWWPSAGRAPVRPRSWSQRLGRLASILRFSSRQPSSSSVAGSPPDTMVGLRAAQAAIVQRQLEAVVLGEKRVAVALGDRGTIDVLAYWPDDLDGFWTAMETSCEEDLERLEEPAAVGSSPGHLILLWSPEISTCSVEPIGLRSQAGTSRVTWVPAPGRLWISSVAPIS